MLTQIWKFFLLLKWKCKPKPKVEDRWSSFGIQSINILCERVWKSILDKNKRGREGEREKEINLINLNQNNGYVDITLISIPSYIWQNITPLCWWVATITKGQYLTVYIRIRLENDSKTTIGYDKKNIVDNHNKPLHRMIVCTNFLSIKWNDKMVYRQDPPPPPISPLYPFTFIFCYLANVNR